MKIPSLPEIERQSLRKWNDKRSAVVFTTEQVWDLVKDQLDIFPHQKFYVAEATKPTMDHFVNQAEGEVVYGIGGGLAIDTAKYVAAHLKKSLFAVPTVLSTDAFLTDATGVRINGCVRYLASKSPDLVLVDIDLLCRAPIVMRTNGAADVLSIATGMWDWQYAQDTGKNPSNQMIESHAVEIGNAILKNLIKNAKEIGNGTAAGMKVLFDLLCLEVQLCYLCGHSRLEEGSEHYFVYSLENFLNEHALHGDLVGLGILLMSALQDQEWQPYQTTLEQLRINYRPPGVTEKMIINTLVGLSAYVKEHQLPHTIAADRNITTDLAISTIEEVLG